MKGVKVRNIVGSRYFFFFKLKKYPCGVGPSGVANMEVLLSRRSLFNVDMFFFFEII